MDEGKRGRRRSFFFKKYKIRPIVALSLRRRRRRRRDEREENGRKGGDPFLTKGKKKRRKEKRKENVKANGPVSCLSATLDGQRAVPFALYKYITSI